MTKNVCSEHGGNIWSKIKSLSTADDNLTDFSTNTNPLGFPKETNKIIQDNISNIRHYPDPDCLHLRQNISKYLNINYKNIIAGNGSSELFYSTISTIKPARILLPAPSFSEYEKASLLSGASVSFVSYEKQNGEFFMDIEKITKELPQINAFMIGNPNNPTGSIIDHDVLMFIIKKAQENNCFVLIDEAFIDFAENGKELSLIKDIPKNDNIIVFRSLTKIFAIPGLRLGYAAANANMIEKIRAHQPDWPVNLFAQTVGAELIKNKDFIKKTLKIIEEEKRFLYESISKIKGLKPYKSHANFLIIEIPKAGLDSKAIKSKLLSQDN
ncbi:MAG: aminotransferase class I/II-fold pyridoxal phosphate-dependent enzyme, partial [Actinomycetota bacterium]|nr:aminotransferase class I/II-fold pyridoxal phosphate-dependent enzyme [Actinomycetota bacterium]